MKDTDFGAVCAKFSGLRIAVLGDLMLDRFVYGSVERISPEAPVPVLRYESEAVFPGGAANVAVNVKSLGASPMLFGVIGGDMAGLTLMGELERLGINRDGVVPLSSATTTVKTRFVSTGQQLLRLDEERNFTGETRAKGMLSEFVEDCDALLVSDYNKGVIPSIAQRYIRAARKAGIPVIVDPKPPNWKYYRGCDVVTPNRKEAVSALPEEARNRAGLAETASRVRELAGAKSVVMTWGAEGMHVFDGKRFDTVPSHRVQVFDPTGAGDSVIAALACAIAAGCDLLAAAGFANAAGAVAVAKPGIAAVTPDEVLRVLEGEKGQKRRRK